MGKTKLITKPFIKDLKKHKDAIIIGGITGAFAAYYTISQGVDLSTITNAGKGLLDIVMARSAPVDVATYKLYIAFISLGCTVSYLADKFVINKFMR